jgi:hypothetical protein
LIFFAQLIAELIREYSTHPLTDNQVRVLLVYVQADLDDIRKHSIAFGVLRAIILRKVLVPEVYDVMDRVSELLIQSKDENCRTQARQVCVCLVFVGTIVYNDLSYRPCCPFCSSIRSAESDWTRRSIFSSPISTTSFRRVAKASCLCLRGCCPRFGVCFFYLNA